jgi:hypothetical protein
VSDILYRVQTSVDPLDTADVLFVTRSRKPNKGDYAGWAEKLIVEYGTTIHAIYEDIGRGSFGVGLVPAFETEAYKAKREALVAYNEDAYEVEGPLYDVSRHYEALVSAMQSTASDFERVAESLRKHVTSVVEQPSLYLYKDDRWTDHFYNAYVGRFFEDAAQQRVERNLKDVAVAGAALDRALLRSRPIVGVRLSAQAPDYVCCDEGAANPLYVTVPATNPYWKSAPIVCAHCGTELPPLPRYDIPAIPAPTTEEEVA